jgi:hypothetical protein
MSNILINLRPKPYYRGVKSLDGNTYRFTFWWNIYSSKWMMSIDGINNTVSIRGIALLCGKDLLKAHGYSDLGELWVIDNGGTNEDPNYDEIGSRWTLEYVPKPVVTPAAAVVTSTTDLEIWVEVTDYNGTTIQAVLDWGDTLIAGEDVDWSAMDAYIETVYGQAVTSNVGTTDAWGAQSTSDITVSATQIAVFASARIRPVPA